MGESQSRPVSPRYSPGGFSQFEDQDEDGQSDAMRGNEDHDGLKIPPFEFVALEACLEATCSCLENEVKFFFFLFICSFVAF